MSSTVWQLLLAVLAGGVAAWLWLRTRFVLLEREVSRLALSSQAELERAQMLESTLGHERAEMARLSVYADQVSTVEEKYSSVLAEQQRLNEQIKMMTQEVTYLRAESERFQSKGRGLEDLLASKSGELDEARSDMLKQAERLAMLTESQRGLQGALAEKEGQQEALQQEVQQLRQDNAGLREKQGELASRFASVSEMLDASRQAMSAAVRERDDAATEVRQLSVKVSELASTLDAERTQHTEKLELLNEARETLRIQFENLANQILEEKGQKFTAQNQENLGLLLAPLQERIREFQSQVASTYDKDSKERLTLKNEIERLAALNTRISEDAVNLTQALKGSNKAQGTWGEVVLESVLESSGLRKGLEYVTQASYEREDGGQHRPDVVVNLPEGKHLVIDSKMSLLAYVRYTEAQQDADRQLALRQHLQSVRAHIKGLSEKKYQSLYGLKSLDFVLLFVPVEPAFMLAVTEDSALFSDAFTKNVLLVSPSTLLATLRTIANIWRQEYQNRNAQEIAGQCAKLYDKFVGFVEDLEDVGRKLQQTQKSYESAHNKLKSGRGNLIRQAESFRKLGVKPSKQLPADLVELSDDLLAPPEPDESNG